MTRLTTENGMNQKTRLAAIINAVLSLLGLVLSLVGLIQGGPDQPPFAILLSGVVLGLAGLAGSYGIWIGKKWGVILTIVVRAIDGLSALPGLFFAPSGTLFFWALVSVLGAAAVIVLLVLGRREAKSVATA